MYNGIDFAANDEMIEQSRVWEREALVRRPFVLHLARLVPVKAAPRSSQIFGYTGTLSGNEPERAE